VDDGWSGLGKGRDDPTGGFPAAQARGAADMSDHDPAGPSDPARADQAPDGAPAGSEPVRGRTIRPWLSHPRTGWIVAAALALAVIGLSIAVALPSTATATPPVAGGPSSGPAAGGGGSNARSGPAAGGTVGTVTSVSASTVLLTTAAGQAVTVDETSGTTYQNGTGPASANAVTTGTDVLVLGTVSGTTITATQVLVSPPAATDRRLPRRPGWSPSNAVPRRPRSRSVRSRRTTPKGRGRSSAARRRTPRRRLRWQPIRAASSTVWCS
jgi:hypothetical protein